MSFRTNVRNLHHKPSRTFQSIEVYPQAGVSSRMILMSEKWDPSSLRFTRDDIGRSFSLLLPSERVCHSERMWGISITNHPAHSNQSRCTRRRAFRQEWFLWAKSEIPRRFALLGMTLVVLLVFYCLRNAFVIPNASEESPSQTLHAHSNQSRCTRRRAFRQEWFLWAKSEIPRRFALLGMTLVALLGFYRYWNTFCHSDDRREEESLIKPKSQILTPNSQLPTPKKNRPLKSRAVQV